VSRTRTDYVNYNDVDLGWYWLLFAQDYNNWEHLSTGCFLNPLVNSFFVMSGLSSNIL
jgi:hypothetical protein